MRTCRRCGPSCQTTSGSTRTRRRMPASTSRRTVGPSSRRATGAPSGCGRPTTGRCPSSSVRRAPSWAPSGSRGPTGAPTAPSTPRPGSSPGRGGGGSEGRCGPRCSPSPSARWGPSRRSARPWSTTRRRSASHAPSATTTPTVRCSRNRGRSCSTCVSTGRRGTPRAGRGTSSSRVSTRPCPSSASSRDRSPRVNPPTLAAVLDGVRAVLLDVDDTIVDTQEAMVAAGTEAAAAIWPYRSGVDHRAMAQRYYDDPERWFPRYASGDVPFDTMRSGRLAEVAVAFGLEVPDGAHRSFEDAYAPAFRSAQRLFPDVPGLLSAAGQEGLPVALLTNSAHAPTRVKLEALDLAERFEVVVTTDTLGFGKPDARVYLEACRLLAAEPAQVVCIGDNVEWDVLGAEAAGLRAVWLDRAGRGGRRGATSRNGKSEPRRGPPGPAPP